MSERSEPRPDGGSGSSGWAEVPGYDLHQLVRRSPASEVYLGSRQGTGADRALTVVYRLAEREATALRHAVEDEAAAARFTGHPAIMAVEGVGLTRAGRVYVAAARPVGFTLERVLAGGRALTLAQARPLALVIAEAVAAAHDYGVVHGRLTPDAIVLVPQPAGRPERVTVCDFGTAPVQDPTLVPGLVPDADRPFVSPERAGGAPPSVRDDVFALGSLLLAACTGVHPAVVGPSGRRRGGVVDADALPGALAAVIERARAADPARRYASAHEFAAALRDVHEIAHETARAEGPDAPVPLPVRITPAAPVARVAPAIPVAAIPGRRRTLAALAAAAAIVAVWSARGWRDRTTAAARAPLDQTARVRAPAGALGDASGAPSAAAGGAGDSRPPARVVERQLSAAPPLPTPAPAPTPRREARRPDIASSQAIQLAAAPRDAGSTPAPIGATAVAAGDVVAVAPAVAPAAAPADARAAAAAESRSVTGVRAAVAEYGGAIESRDLARLERVYPGMTEAQRRAWAAFFGSATDLRARLVVDEVTVTGATALARVRGTYEYENARPRRAERAAVSFTATLAREGEAWRVRAVE